MNRLATSCKAAVTTAIRAAGCQVTVHRGEDSFEIERAGLTKFRQSAAGLEGEIRVDLTDARDLLVWPADYTLDDVAIEPEAGDRFEIELPTDEIVWFECSPFPPEPAWRWTDQFQTAYRIHLKKVEVEE